MCVAVPDRRLLTADSCQKPSGFHRLSSKTWTFPRKTWNARNSGSSARRKWFGPSYVTRRAFVPYGPAQSPPREG